MPAIVTRPAPEAQRWAERLAAAGIDALALPLIEIAPPADPAPLVHAWQALGTARAAMFVSGNAVRHFFAARPAGASFEIRAWAPGPGTREALLQAGVAAARIDAPAADAAQFDSEALWSAVRGSVQGGDRVLLVRGADAAGQAAGRDWLAGQLHAAGARVDSVAAYVRRPPHWQADKLELARRCADTGIWLFSSSEAVANLRRLLPGQSWGAAQALATHPRIARAARDAGFGVVHASRPAFDDVLASLQSLR
ncbi:MAG: uroporphyrinogen-III synthase [Pseudomonadota bacterium]